MTSNYHEYEVINFVRYRARQGGISRLPDFQRDNLLCKDLRGCVGLSCLGLPTVPYIRAPPATKVVVVLLKNT